MRIAWENVDRVEASWQHVKSFVEIGSYYEHDTHRRATEITLYYDPATKTFWEHSSRWGYRKGKVDEA